MLRIDELLDCQEKACFITTLDIMKRYWQSTLDSSLREKTDFAMPTRLYQCTWMTFGLYGATATFQRLTDHLLQLHSSYAAAYINNVMIYSQC